MDVDANTTTATDRDLLVQQVILAVDVGSSSIRCSAYAYDCNRDDDLDDIQMIEGCHVSIPRSSVEPISGHILLNLAVSDPKLVEQERNGSGGGGKEDDVTSNEPPSEPTTLSSSTMMLLDVIDSAVIGVMTILQENQQDVQWKTKRFDVVAIGFSSFVMNFIAVDSDGMPISDALTLSYACNSHDVNQECTMIREQLDTRQQQLLYSQTGAPIHSAYALPQLRVLYGKNDTTLTERIHSWQTIASLCVSRWTSSPRPPPPSRSKADDEKQQHHGQKYNILPISYSEASWTGLLDIRTCQYNTTALELLPPQCRAALPPLADYCDDTVHLVGGIPRDNPYSEKFGLGRLLNTNCKFFLGIGDGACANIGSKATSPSRIAITIGTSAAARMVLNRETVAITPTSKSMISSASSSATEAPASSSNPKDDGEDQFEFDIPKYQGLFCYRINRQQVLIGGALSDGGSVIEWARSFLNLTSGQEFDDCMKQVHELVKEELLTASAGTEAGDRADFLSHELIMVPFLSGERSPGFREGAVGATYGFTKETTPAHFMKSCLEGVALRLNAVLHLILKASFDSPSKSSAVPVLVASGKALEVNHVWRQMIADCSGMKIILDQDSEEGTSRGVARLVAAAITSAKWTTDKQSIIPKEESIHIMTQSIPRDLATNRYRYASERQEKLIGSVTPLFGRNTCLQD